MKTGATSTVTRHPDSPVPLGNWFPEATTEVAPRPRRGSQAKKVRLGFEDRYLSHMAKESPDTQVSETGPSLLFGVADIARTRGVSVQVADNWRRRGKLPDPDFVTSGGRLLWWPKTLEAATKNTLD